MKRFLMVVPLLLLAALGAWWKLTEVDRNVAAIRRGDDAWDWAIAHKNEPGVTDAVRERVHQLVTDPSCTVAQLDQVTKFYAAVGNGSGSDAAVAYVRLRYEPALNWQGPDSGDYVTAEGLRQLDGKPAEEVEATLQWLLPDAQRNIRGNPQWVSDAVMVLWAHYGTPTASDFYARLSRDDQESAVRNVLIQTRELDQQSFERVYGELARLKPFPDSRMVEVLAGKYGDRPETEGLFRAWPAAVRALVEASGGRLEKEDAERMARLLAKLDGAPSAPTYLVNEAIENFVRGKEESELPGFSGKLLCMHKFSAEEGRQMIETLSKLPADQLLGNWETEARPAASHVLARALARVDPKRMAETLQLKLERFEPMARLIEANALTPEKVPGIDAASFRSLAPSVWEGVAAFAELDTVPDVAVPAMWEAVGSPSSKVSERAALGLDKGRTTARFVEGLFTHLSVKETYSLEEINIMSARLIAHADAGPFIVKALEDALKAMEGHPEQVPLVKKLVGFKALAKLKTPASKARLNRYLEDPSTYLEDRVTKSSTGAVSHEQKSLTFAELAKQALE